MDDRSVHEGRAPPLALIIPMVGNFTEDEENGSIDVCDMPDIITVDFSGRTEMFAGDSGDLRDRVPGPG